MEERKIPGMYTCCVCGQDFPLVVERRYTAEYGVCLVSTLYDAIDCPHCGCQNILQERKRIWHPPVVKGHDEEGSKG